jgi:hypothetical protein
MWRSEAPVGMIAAESIEVRTRAYLRSREGQLGSHAAAAVGASSPSPVADAVPPNWDAVLHSSPLRASVSHSRSRTR